MTSLYFHVFFYNSQHIFFDMSPCVTLNPPLNPMLIPLRWDQLVRGRVEAGWSDRQLVAKNLCQWYSDDACFLVIALLSVLYLQKISCLHDVTWWLGSTWKMHFSVVVSGSRLINSEGDPSCFSQELNKWFYSKVYFKNLHIIFMFV